MRSGANRRKPQQRRARPLYAPPLAAPALGSVGFIDDHPPPQGFSTIGAVDCLLGATVLGWAYNPDFPRRRAKITLVVGGRLVGETVANGLRPELVGVAGYDGFGGFICAIPLGEFKPGAAVRISADGTELRPSPLILGPEQIDGAVEPIVGSVISGWVRERVLAPTRAVLDMVADGRPVRTVTADRFRPELKENKIGDGCFGFAEAVPDSCLDGDEHRIEFRHRASGLVIPPGTVRFRASFAGLLERLDQNGGSGWVFCREAPDRPMSLDVIVNGMRVGVVANRPRPDVSNLHGGRDCGFEFGIPERVSRHRELSVEIRIAGTANPAIPGSFTFTPMSRVIEQVEEIAAHAAGRDAVPGEGYSRLRETIIPRVLATLRAQGRRPGPLDLSPGFDRSPLDAPAAAVSDIVDVVIPVYGGHDETLACIEAVAQGANTTRCEIIVIDDCGPDPKLRAALRESEGAGAITLLVNPVNLGFPGAANAGMSLHPDRDVIVLNSDTLVPKGWIDRLRAAAYRAPNIGTVTPLSNRATICSYPEINQDNDLPGELPWEALDQICSEVNEGRAVDIPTAVGFCAYLRRAMLREVGLFDSERWNKGYGEENEVCILAAARGWRHVLAPNLFVVHHGAVSFGTEARREALKTNLVELDRLYPDYFPRIMDFLRRDPVALVRRAVDWARVRALSGRFILHVSHQAGGGTKIYVDDLARRLHARGEHALILEGNADGSGAATLRSPVLGTKSIYALPGEYDVLIADLRAAGIWHIHFHQIMGAERWARLPTELDCPYDITVHDYAFFCPRIDLIDESGQYCGEPAVEVCERCVSLNEPHPDLCGAFRDRGGSVGNWVALHRRLLEGARRVFTPSTDTARRLEKHLPGIAYRPHPHPEPSRRVAIRRPASSDAARVAVIGALAVNKGRDLLLACARDALKRGLPIQFRLFGFAAGEAELRRLENVHITGEFKRPDLPRLVAQNPCDLALFLSIWPETFCYALSDAYEVGLYPIALDFGAVGERIAANKVGTLLPHRSTPAEINSAILAEIGRTGQWPTSLEIGQDYNDILEDYYGLQPSRK